MSKPKFVKKKLIKNFFLKAIACYFIWQVIYIGFIRPDGNIDRFLTNLSIAGTTKGFSMLGVNSFSEENVIYINNIPAVRIENVCNGLELLILYVGFLICFPGRLKYKIIYGISGCLVLLIINIIREMLLAVNYLYFEQSFQINHKYTYTIIVYLIVFLLWKHWIVRYSIISSRNERAT